MSGSGEYCHLQLVAPFLVAPLRGDLMRDDDEGGSSRATPRGSASVFTGTGSEARDLPVECLAEFCWEDSPTAIGELFMSMPTPSDESAAGRLWGDLASQVGSIAGDTTWSGEECRLIGLRVSVFDHHVALLTAVISCPMGWSMGQLLKLEDALDEVMKGIAREAARVLLERVDRDKRPAGRDFLGRRDWTDMHGDVLWVSRTAVRVVHRKGVAASYSFGWNTVEIPSEVAEVGGERGDEPDPASRQTNQVLGAVRAHCFVQYANAVFAILTFRSREVLRELASVSRTGWFEGRGGRKEFEEALKSASAWRETTALVTSVWLELRVKLQGNRKALHRLERAYDVKGYLRLLRQQQVAINEAERALTASRQRQGARLVRWVLSSLGLLALLDLAVNASWYVRDEFGARSGAESGGADPGGALEGVMDGYVDLAGPYALLLVDILAAGSLLVVVLVFVLLWLHSGRSASVQPDR